MTSACSNDLERPHRPVVIFSAGIGAGHDGAARELARRLRARGLRRSPW